ncbi:hypothetical protein CRM22_004622 [Opisthorchis felineus]|uniref:Phosphoribosyltransferase domain-containing protein n=1 Tax=Opisthorchis felineus TaxID=147828 RepID=A0A4S2LV71_OPIFE|nr:hypothetical protein CRM22_004622 [Opisthorchis felineus]
MASMCGSHVANGVISPSAKNCAPKKYTPEVQDVLSQFSKNIILLPPSDHVRLLQTVLRNRDTPRNEFIFYADRLIRLIVEEGLNQLPYEEVTVTTPTESLNKEPSTHGPSTPGCPCPCFLITVLDFSVVCQVTTSTFLSGHLFHGVKFLRGNCGVSVVRSGEAMERGLRDCCRSIRIGKILIQANNEDGSNDVKVYYAKLPPNISQRKILLMYPILGSGNTVLKALDVLRTYDVPMENVILLTLFVSPEGLRNVLVRNPVLRVVTSEVHPVVPTHFGQRYFGTS